MNDWRNFGWGRAYTPSQEELMGLAYCGKCLERIDMCICEHGWSDVVYGETNRAILEDRRRDRRVAHVPHAQCTKEHIHTILPGDYKPTELFYNKRQVVAFIIGLVAAIVVISGVVLMSKG